MNHFDKVKKIAEQSAVYVAEDCEGIRISTVLEDHFVGTGEDTGDFYEIVFDDVDLDNDLFYKLVLVEVE